MKRPLFAYGLLLMASMAAIQAWGTWMALGLVPGAVIALLLLPQWDARQRDALLLGTCLAFLTALGLLGSFQHRLTRTAQATAGAQISFTGYVAEESPYSSTLNLVRGHSPQLGRVTLWLRSYGEDGLEAGDWITGSAAITGAGPEGHSLLSGGITLSAVAGELQLTQPGPGLLWRVHLLRRQLTQRMLAAHPDPDTGMLLGLLFSDRTHLDPVTAQAMNLTGTGHILSVSGLHLSIFVGWVLWVCRRLQLGPWATLGLGLTTVLLVAAVAGFGAPVLRAGVMMTLWLLGRAIGRRSDSLTSLGAAVCLLLFLCPPALGTLGFQMSFFATLGVAALASPLTDWGVTWLEARTGRRDGWVSVLAGAVAIPLSAQLGLMPVALWSSGFVPLYSLPANLLLGPLLWPALLLGTLAALAFAPGLPLLVPVGTVLLRAAAWLCQGMAAVCRFFATLPGGIFPLQLPHQWGLVLVLAGGVAAAVLLRVQGRKLTRLLGLTLALCLGLGLAGHLAYGSRVILTAAPGGTVVLRKGSMAVLLYEGEGDYDREMASRAMLRAGVAQLPLRVLARPWGTTPQGDLAAAQAFAPRVLLRGPREQLPRPLPGVEQLPLTPTPVELWPGATLSAPSAYQTQLLARGQKLVKCWAGYGLITQEDIPWDTTLVIDMAGLVYSPGGKLNILRLWTGDSVVVLPN